MFLASVRDLPLVKCTFDLADPDHVPLRLLHLRSVFLVIFAVEFHPDLLLVLLPHLVWRSTNRPVVGVVVGVDDLREDTEVVPCLVGGEVAPDP